MTTTHQGISVGIDATRNRSGGAITHIRGILAASNPRDHGVREVHVWSYRKLLDSLPDAKWLVRHHDEALEGRLREQMSWQRRRLSKAVTAAGCDVLLTTDAGSVARHRPSIAMSRDMLSFEPGEIDRYPALSAAWLRLKALQYVQVASLRRASGALFLTHYAQNVIGRFTGPLAESRVIPHGIGDAFRAEGPHTTPPSASAPAIRCIYVSNADRYKHQWHVLTALDIARQRGVPVTLQLVGAASGPSANRVTARLEELPHLKPYVELMGATPHEQVPALLAKADIFVFASSCENMPNTLIEGMAAGLPVACAKRGPMPEILQDGGAYFDPEDPETIADALCRLATDDAFALTSARRSFELAQQFSWRRCAAETWAYLCDIAGPACAGRPSL